MTKRLAIIVPCYNEEEVFGDTNTTLVMYLKSLIKRELIDKRSFIVYVDDGSKDTTWNKIEEANKQYDCVDGIKLAGNRGHQNALYAGLMETKEIADMTVTIDADLQDDINVIEEMIDKYYQGYEIVYGVRKNRDSDSIFKRKTAQVYYKLMNLLGCKTIYNSADFRLLSKRAVEELSKYSETHLFLRGLVRELGLKEDCVYYTRKPRLKGKTKYSIGKMVSLGVDGVTSFSDKPLTIIIVIGLIAILISIIAIVYSLIRHIQGETVQGWTSLFVSIWFIGGVQLVSLGVIGKYVGKAYIESKKRPRYIIDEKLLKDN